MCPARRTDPVLYPCFGFVRSTTAFREAVCLVGVPRDLDFRAAAGGRCGGRRVLTGVRTTSGASSTGVTSQSVGFSCWRAPQRRSIMLPNVGSNSFTARSARTCIRWPHRFSSLAATLASRHARSAWPTASRTKGSSGRSRAAAVLVVWRTSVSRCASQHSNARPARSKKSLTLVANASSGWHMRCGHSAILTAAVEQWLVRGAGRQRGPKVKRRIDDLKRRLGREDGQGRQLPPSSKHQCGSCGRLNAESKAQSMTLGAGRTASKSMSHHYY